MIDVHVLDLDRTIWDCHDRFGNIIWAKQLLPPFSLSKRQAVDDVGNVCTIRKGVHEYIASLSTNGAKICFSSVGGVYGLPIEHQPSIILLETFHIKSYFDLEKSWLGYKSDSKKEHLESFGKCFFYDDDLKNHAVASDIPAVRLIDTSSLKDWTSFQIPI